VRCSHEELRAALTGGGKSWWPATRKMKVAAAVIEEEG
jgi:hypothetical protein